MYRNLGLGAAVLAGAVLAAAAVRAAAPAAAEEPDDPLVKRNAVKGDPGKLPDGYFVYDCGVRRTGLYMTPLRKFQKSVVPHTENDYPQTLATSDDGAWILYWTPKELLGVDRGANASYPARLILVRRDGSGYTEIPTGGKFKVGPNKKSGEDTNCANLGSGFLRRSPYGDATLDYQTKNAEIWYAGGRSIHALRVDLSATPPKIGAERRILYVPPEQDARNQTFEIEGNPFRSVDVSGSHIFCNGYMWTIPDGGKGTAGTKTRYPQNYGGCAWAMSHDGSFIAKNGRVGSHVTPGGHSGFNLYEFLENTAPKYSEDEIGEKHRVSTNFALPGLHYAHCYNGTNQREYLTCMFQGGWLIHWPTNTWYQIVPSNTGPLNTAAWLPKGKV
jgi:hypothetical protein